MHPIVFSLEYKLTVEILKYNNQGMSFLHLTLQFGVDPILVLQVGGWVIGLPISMENLVLKNTTEKLDRKIPSDGHDYEFQVFFCLRETRVNDIGDG